MNMFLESQKNLFDYYCTYFRLEDFSSVRFEKKPTITLVLISEYWKETAETISKGNIKVQCMIIHPKFFKENSWENSTKSLNVFAVFDENPKERLISFEEAVSNSIENCREVLSKGKNAPIWTYNAYKPKHNLNPPLLPLNANITRPSDLKSYLMLDEHTRLNKSYQVVLDENTLSLI